MPMKRCCATLLLTMLLGAGCAYEVGFNPDYVPPERPTFVADGALLVVIREDQAEFLYAGPPDSRIGDFTTMTIPLGAIVSAMALTIVATRSWTIAPSSRLR